MILNISGRTDIPAWYTPWLLNRIRDASVCVRNPYNEHQISRYRLSPDVVDCIMFCSKNPLPLLPHIAVLADFRLYFHVTITPYGTDVEPNVPEYTEVATAVHKLSAILGRENVVWRYDPILFFGSYDAEFHIRYFDRIASLLAGSVNVCVISFLDQYEKVQRNFPLGRAPAADEQIELVRYFSQATSRYGMRLQSCAEAADLSVFGVTRTPCLTQELLEHLARKPVSLPRGAGTLRENCGCLPWRDIGAYDTCPHGCRYCYANSRFSAAIQNYRRHDPASPLLCSKITAEDRITDVPQLSFFSEQYSLFN